MDMTDAERQLMHEHVAYWTSLAEKGLAVLFGPVLDPAGPYGIGIVEVDKEEDVEAVKSNDPVMRSGSEFRYEVFAMPRAIVRN